MAKRSTPSIDQAELDRLQRRDVRVDGDPRAVWVEVHAGTASYQVAAPMASAPDMSDDDIDKAVEATRTMLTHLKQTAIEANA
jgi:hypothetical protein